MGAKEQGRRGAHKRLLPHDKLERNPNPERERQKTALIAVKPAGKALFLLRWRMGGFFIK
jgi:hypothetical protein